MKKVFFAGFLLVGASAAAALKTTWDVGDYVQDSLVMHYDAIRNVGATKPHDSAATVWQDLSPVGGSAKNRACVYGGNGYWTEKAYVFTGVSCLETTNQPELGNVFTVQLACQLDITSDSRTYPTVFGPENFSIWLNRSYAAQQALTNVYWTTDRYGGNTSGNRPETAWKDGRYLTAAFDDTYMYLFTGTTWESTTSKWGLRQKRQTSDPLPPLTYFIGGRPVGGTSGGRNYCSIGEFYAVRAYTRKLTNEEMAHNRAIDEIRFHGKAVLPYTNVVVAASVPAGVCATEPPGAYVVEGEHTFTANPVLVNGSRFAVDGYYLETWEPSLQQWGRRKFHAGAAYTYVVSPDQPMVRLTWRWKLVSGIERYDVHHYVQEGLLANYDAVRNAGESALPSRDGARWTDCSTNAATASCGLSVYAGDPGTWTDKAYVFAGESYWRMDEALALGMTFTLQIACKMEVDSFKTGRIYPTLLFGTDSFLMQMDRKFDVPSGTRGTNIYWNVDAFDSGERPTMAWADGKYINAAFTQTHKYWTSSTDWTKRWSPPRKDQNPVTAIRYAWGGKTSWGVDYGIFGDFHALRFYSRVLTNAELEQNREVDEVRFFGAAPTGENGVWVVSSREGLSGVESGAYKLAGSYEFTAPERVEIDGERFAVVGSVVETWDAQAKAWTSADFAVGPSRLLVAASSAPARRLTWRWRRDRGLLLLLQ